LGALAAPATAQPSVVDIVSRGPLTRIAISSELNCQVGHQGDEAYEFFDGSSEIAACATILSVNGTQYGPSEIPAAALELAPWTPISQSAVTGNGSSDSPYTVTTVVGAGPSVRLTEVDSYVTGLESYRTDLTLQNAGGTPVSGVLYRAGDC